jgi:hypothetical protein
MQARRTHARTCRVRARARVSVCDWAPTHPRRHMRARSVGVDRGWLGSQAFNSATAFSADIGAWSTAAVTTLSSVCAAFSARAARHRRRDALGRVVGAGRSVVRGGTADARASVCAQTCGHAHARVCTCVGIAARSKDGIHACVYMYAYICVLYSLCVCTCARDGYGCACGGTNCNAHVRAIARAEDAAVAITCARGYVRQHV